MFRRSTSYLAAIAAMAAMTPATAPASGSDPHGGFQPVVFTQSYDRSGHLQVQEHADYVDAFSRNILSLSLGIVDGSGRSLLQLVKTRVLAVAASTRSNHIQMTLRLSQQQLRQLCRLRVRVFVTGSYQVMDDFGHVLGAGGAPYQQAIRLACRRSG